MGVRRAHHSEPREPGELPVVAIASLAYEKAIVLQPLLRARGAEARGGGVELDLQGGRAQRKFGGERGIRTPGTDNRTTDFESAALDHSAISPRPERTANFIRCVRSSLARPCTA